MAATGKWNPDGRLDELAWLIQEAGGEYAESRGHWGSSLVLTHLHRKSQLALYLHWGELHFVRSDVVFLEDEEFILRVLGDAGVALSNPLQKRYKSLQRGIRKRPVS